MHPPSIPADAPAQSLELRAADGTPLAATLFEADGPSTRALVIAGGTGIRRRFYGALARWLCAGGWTVLTFDYRGIGDSVRGGVRASRARMADWGRQDLEAALAWLHAAQPAGRRALVAHSAGGQLLGLAPSARQLDCAAFVASQSGSWRLWPAPSRWAAAALWHAVPVVTRVAGYFPSALFGLGEPLPRGVAEEWARWCRHPDYLFGCLDAAELGGYGALTLPLRAYSFPDDPIAPPRAAAAILDRYPAARATHLVVDAASLQRRRLGHFGFFRPAVGGALWPDLLRFLDGGAA